MQLVGWEGNTQPIDVTAQVDALTKLGVEGLVLQLLFSLVVLLAAWLLGWRAQDAARNAVLRARGDQGLALLVARITSFFVLALALSAVLTILGINWTGLVAILGTVGLAISLALQDVLRNLFAGLYLLLERPFQIGDRIDVRTFGGTVEDVRLRVTVLRTANGLQVVIPNAVVFTETITNRSAYGHERLVVRVAVADGGDFQSMGSQLLDAVRSVDGVIRSPASDVVVVSLGAGSQTLDVTCWMVDRSPTVTAVLAALRAVAPSAELTVDPGSPH